MITATKRRKIMKDMAGHEGVVTRERMRQLSARYNETMIDIRDFLSSGTFFCEQLLTEEEKEAKREKPKVRTNGSKPRCPISDPEAAMLRSGKLYKDMGEGQWVLVKRSQFEKEREAIIKLLDAFA